MIRVLGSAALLIGVLEAAHGTPWWVSYEANPGYPEQEGWTRVWGNWQGQYQGSGANRTLENGILTYDSLYDAGVYDYNYIERPGELDPGDGETLVMEWRLKVDTVQGWLYDPTVDLASDTGMIVGFAFAYDEIYSLFEDNVHIAILPGEFHNYLLESESMLSYKLYVDGALVRTGAFWQSLSYSRVGWGDGAQGSASLHRWDYFRVGAVPAPQAFPAFLLCAASSRRRKR